MNFSNGSNGMYWTALTITADLAILSIVCLGNIWPYFILSILLDLWIGTFIDLSSLSSSSSPFSFRLVIASFIENCSSYFDSPNAILFSHHTPLRHSVSLFIILSIYLSSLYPSIIQLSLSLILLWIIIFLSYAIWLQIDATELSVCTSLQFLHHPIHKRT